MLLHDAALSFVHFVFAFLVVGTLSAEAFVLRLPVDARVARLLLRIDLFYGIAALGVILAGVSRVIWGAKGGAYYMAEPFFWAKMGAFAIVGLISIAPTMAYLRWNRAGAPDEAAAKRIRRLVMAELHVLVLVPLFAALMARGIGM